MAVQISAALQRCATGFTSPGAPWSFPQGVTASPATNFPWSMKSSGPTSTFPRGFQSSSAALSPSEYEFAEVAEKEAAKAKPRGKKPIGWRDDHKKTAVPGVAFPDGNLLRQEVHPEASAEHADKSGLGKVDETVTTSIPEAWGRVHSIESFSAIDGPGIRSVVFTQGCLRRCLFCGNPDTWSYMANCQRLSSKQVAAKLKRNLKYYEGGGGVTMSGGEPMMQPQFVASVFKEAHALGITTCIDTAGYGKAQDWANVLPNTDTVMLCTKAMDPKLYFKMVEVKQSLMLDFAKAVAEYGVPLVIRFVLVTGMTDTAEEVEALVAWAKEQPTLVGIEMLPYHRLGVNKWEALKIPYPLEGMEPPPKEVVQHWKDYIQKEGIKVML